MTDTADETAAREHIATLRNQIEQERAFTVERTDRLRRFARGDELDRRLREEWEHFADRTRPMQQEIDATIKLLAKIEGFKVPPPIFIPRANASILKGDRDDRHSNSRQSDSARQAVPILRRDA